MPWTPNDAIKHTHKAMSAKSRRQWAHVANSVLQRGADEGTAVREANGVVGGEGGLHKERVSNRKNNRTHRGRYGG